MLAEMRDLLAVVCSMAITSQRTTDLLLKGGPGVRQTPTRPEVVSFCVFAGIISPGSDDQSGQEVGFPWRPGTLGSDRSVLRMQLTKIRPTNAPIFGRCCSGRSFKSSCVEEVRQDIFFALLSCE